MILVYAFETGIESKWAMVDPRAVVRDTEVGCKCSSVARAGMKRAK